MDRITIRDVALRAGVSRQTVSSGHQQQPRDRSRNPPTRPRRRPGTRLPPLRRRPRPQDQTHRLLGLVVPDIANPFFAEVVRGASEVAWAQDYSVLLCNTDERPEREWATLHMLEAHRVDGPPPGQLAPLGRAAPRGGRGLPAPRHRQPPAQRAPRPGLRGRQRGARRRGRRGAPHLSRAPPHCLPGRLGRDPFRPRAPPRLPPGAGRPPLERDAAWDRPCPPTVEGAAPPRWTCWPATRGSMPCSPITTWWPSAPSRPVRRWAARCPRRSPWSAGTISSSRPTSPPLTTMRMPKERLGGGHDPAL